MNKEIEEMTDEELIEFINSENEKVVKELTDNDNIFKQIETAKGFDIKYKKVKYNN